MILPPTTALAHGQQATQRVGARGYPGTNHSHRAHHKWNSHAPPAGGLPTRSPANLALGRQASSMTNNSGTKIMIMPPLISLRGGERIRAPMPPPLGSTLACPTSTLLYLQRDHGTWRGISAGRRARNLYNSVGHQIAAPPRKDARSMARKVGRIMALGKRSLGRPRPCNLLTPGRWRLQQQVF